MAGQNKIGIRVFPDTKDFKANLRTTLARVEKQVKLNIGANLDPARRDINRLIVQLRKVKPEIQVDVEVRDAQRKLKDIAKDIKATITADADTAAASARLTAAARPRFVLFRAKLDKSSMANMSRQLAQIAGALSGARLIGDSLKRVGSSLTNLDRSLPRLAAIALTISTIGAAALASVQGVLALGGALAAISGAALVLPALLAGIATSMTVLVMAFKDAGTELASLKPAFAELQDAVSASFWEQAKQPILDLAHSVLPSLKAGLTDVSTSLGGFTAALADALRVTLTADRMQALFGPLAKSIDIAKQAMGPLVEAFTTLGIVGGTQLPRLAGWFVEVSNRFNEWVQTNSANGNMLDWINTGIEQLKHLGNAIKEAGRILGGLFTAANNAGAGNALGTLADSLRKVADIVNAEPFQSALTEIFLGAGEAMKGLGTALGPIGDMFVALAPTIREVLSVAGEALGGLLSSLADALSSPVFAQGLTAFFDGISAGLDAIGPALGPLADAFGTVAEFAGQLAAQLGPVLGAAIQLLAPVISELLTALEPLIPVLGQALIDAISQLAPIFPQLVAAVIPLVGALVTMLPSVVALIPPLVQLATNILTVVEWVAKFVEWISPFVAWLIQAVAWILKLGVALSPVGMMLSMTSGKFQEMVTKVQGLIQGMVLAVVGFFVGLGTKLAATTSGMVQGLVARFNQAKAQALAIWAAIRASIANAINAARAVVLSVVNRIRASLASAFASARAVTASAWGAITSTIRGAITRAMATVQSIRARVMGALSGAGRWLVSAGRDIVNGMISGVRSMIGRLGSIVREMAQNAVNAAKDILNIHSPSRVFRDEVGRMIPAGIEEGIAAGQQSLNQSIESLVDVPDVDDPGPVDGRGPSSGGGDVIVKTADPYVAAKEVVRLQKLGGI